MYVYVCMCVCQGVCVCICVYTAWISVIFMHISHCTNKMQSKVVTQLASANCIKPILNDILMVMHVKIVQLNIYIFLIHLDFI